MRDHIENMEDAIEDWAFDNIKGDKFKCPECGKWKDLEKSEVVSPNPWARPICWDCLPEGFTE